MSKNEKSNALSFDTFEQCLEEQQPKSWLLKNLIARGENSSWFGPPGSLKSALMTDIAVSVASARDWRGHEFDRSLDNPEEDYFPNRGVIYFALERADLTKRRLAAYAFRDKLPSDLPIAVVSETINLLDPRCVDQIVETVEQFEHETHRDVALIIIDTYSKAIAGGDEDKAQTQNIAAMNIKLIQDHLYHGVHIASIGHTGKNEAAGERGSNARRGDVDLQVQITGDTIRTATIVKANDQSERPIASFAMEEVTLKREGYMSGTATKNPRFIEPEMYTVAILAADTPAAAARTAGFQPLNKPRR